MRLAVLTALHGRERLTQVVLEYWARLAERLPVDAVRLQAVASTPTREVPGWHYATAPNRPLARKFNTGMRALRAWAPDAVMVIGSDDLVNQAFVTAAIQEVIHGAEMVYPSCIYMLDTETGHLHYARASYIGAGRVLTAPILDAVDWAPWPPESERKLDGLMRWHLEQSMGRVPRGIQVHPTSMDALENTRVVLDIKTRRSDGRSENMWSIEQLARLLPVLSLGRRDDWLHTHFPDQAETLSTWKLQPLHSTPAYVAATP